MLNPVILLGGVIVLIVLFLILAVMRALEDRQQRLQHRLFGEGGEHAAEGSAVLPGPPRNTRERIDQHFERLARRTGGGLEASQAFAYVFMGAVVLGAVIYLWLDNPLFAVLGMLVGGAIVYAILLRMQVLYLRKIQNQLPDTFFLLARSLRAGMSLDQCISLAAEQGDKPIADEFKQCAFHLRLGLSAPAAVQLMADRLRLVDFNAFASTVALHHNTGGNLALLLDRLAAGTRDRNQFRSHLLAATALGRVTAVFLGCAAPALLLAYAIWQPALVRPFFQSTQGALVVAGVIVMECLGVFWLYNLLRVEL